MDEMENMIKVYEEETVEIQKLWLNEILDEHGIINKNDIKVGTKSNLSPIGGNTVVPYIISVYVKEIDVVEVKRIIEEYKEAAFDESNPEIEGIEDIPDVEEYYEEDDFLIEEIINNEYNI